MKDIDVYREPTHFFSEWAENSNDYLQILDLYTKECWETWQMSVPWPKSESVKVLVTQLCLILCDSVDCSTPGSSVHGILQARIWSGLPFPSPGDFPNPGIEPGSSCIAGGFFTSWGTGGAYQFYPFLIRRLSLQLRKLVTVGVIILWRAASGWMWFSAFVFNELQSLDIFKVTFSEYPHYHYIFSESINLNILFLPEQHCGSVAYCLSIVILWFPSNDCHLV